MISDILVDQKYDLAPNAAVSSDQWQNPLRKQN